MKRKTESISDLPQIRTTKQPRTSVIHENLGTVAEVLVASLVKLTRTAMTGQGIAQISSQRIVNRLKLRPHRPELLHVLQEDDPY